MIALRMVRLVEAHHEELAHSLIRRVEECAKCGELRKLVPREELELRVSELYRHLSEWMLCKPEDEIRATYTALGRRRFEQRVPFHQFFWETQLVKENLWDFLLGESLDIDALALHSEFELLRILGQFFDKSLYYASLGYWKAHELNERNEMLAEAA
jgi:hypothetical protein